MPKRVYRRTTKEQLLLIVPDCQSYNEVCRRLGKTPVGGNTTNIARLCKKYDIDTSHMKGQSHMKGRPHKRRKSASDLLVMGSKLDLRTKPTVLRRALDEIGRPYVCVECGCNGCWNGKPLVLEIDHIDGCYWNNTSANLQYLCPNCHAQKTKDANTKSCK